MCLFRTPESDSRSSAPSRYPSRVGWGLFCLTALIAWTSTATAPRGLRAAPAEERPAVAGGNDSLEANPAELNFHRDILPIFEKRCAECHSERQAKGGLNVLDRDAMFSYIEPGDLESSSLWGDYLATSDPEMRMPPVKHGQPVPPVELAAIRVWIEEGAVWPETAPTASQAPAVERSLLGKLFMFSGHFHPAIVHFPIALLMVSALFVVLSFFSRASFEPAAFHLLWMGALSAVVASVVGWSFAEVRGYGDFWSTSWSEDAIARHRITGVLLSVLAVGLTVVAWVARHRNRFDLRMAWLIGSGLLAAMVSLTGHQGGELTYGEDLYDRAFRQAFGEPAAAPNPVPATDAATTDTPVTDTPADASVEPPAE
jgi:uncharacterized membrane protein